MKKIRVPSRKSVSGRIILTIAGVAILFIIALVSIILLSGDMAKFSSLINDTGRIRGGIQRIVKRELSGIPSDGLISDIDSLIVQTARIEESQFLKISGDASFVRLGEQFSDSWQTLKGEIYKSRTDSSAAPDVMRQSEKLWNLTDRMVTAIEGSSHYNVILYYLIAVIGGIGVIVLVLVLVATKVYVRDRIEYLADHDQLTGLFNRYYFNKVFERECALSSRQSRPFAIIMCDIDHFKRINDTHGHDVGDVVLKMVAQTIYRESRSTDLIARFGGEEFIILTVGGSREQNLAYADKIRRTIETLTVVKNIRVTISLGIAMNGDDDTPKTLVKKADDALYRAKENGRNRIEFA